MAKLTKIQIDEIMEKLEYTAIEFEWNGFYYTIYMKEIEGNIQFELSFCKKSISMEVFEIFGQKEFLGLYSELYIQNEKSIIEAVVTLEKSALKDQKAKLGINFN